MNVVSGYSYDVFNLNNEIVPNIQEASQVKLKKTHINDNVDRSVINYTRSTPAKIALISNIILFFIMARIFFAVFIFLILVYILGIYALPIVIYRLFDIFGYAGVRLLNKCCCITHTIFIALELPLISFTIFVFYVYMPSFFLVPFLITILIVLHLAVQIHFCLLISKLSVSDKDDARSLIKSSKIPFFVCFSQIPVEP